MLSPGATGALSPRQFSADDCGAVGQCLEPNGGQGSTAREARCLSTVRMRAAATSAVSGSGSPRIDDPSIEEVKERRNAVTGGFRRRDVFTQLVGGCLVATGLLAWLGALLLAGFTIAATLLGHRFWLRRGTEFRHELTTSLEHVA
jgi:Flp pilus assembly protein TadB